MFDEIYFLTALFMGFLATYGARVLPLILFKDKKHNENLAFIQKNMPLVIMVVLVFYTFFLYDFSNLKVLFCVLISCVFTFVLEFLFKSAFLSILFGIIFYMSLIKFFI